MRMLAIVVVVMILAIVVAMWRIDRAPPPPSVS